MTNFDDEIDIRPYIQALIKKWWLIGLLILVPASIAAIISLQTPKIYESTATLLINRSQSALELAAQFPTTDTTDPVARMNAILAIARSNVVNQRVFEEMKDELVANNILLKDLEINVKISNDGDLILVKASAKDPNLASKIADEWAAQSVALVNQAFTGEKPLEIIQEQMNTAQLDYQSAQNTLVDFTEKSQLDVLEQKIFTAQNILNTLVNDRALRVAYYYQRLMDLEALQIEAEALKQQLQTGGQSKAAEIGDALAVLQARANALALHNNLELSVKSGNLASSNLPLGNDSAQTDSSAVSIPMTVESSNSTSNNPLTINIQPGDFETILGESAGYVRDLDNMISIFGSEQERLTKEVAIISDDESDNPENINIQAVADQINGLQAQKVTEEAQLRDLTNRRDLAEQAYQALAQKVTEVKNSVQATNQVSLVNPAVPSPTANSRGTLKNVALAAVLGLCLGVGIVVIEQWWKSSASS